MSKQDYHVRQIEGLTFTARDDDMNIATEVIVNKAYVRKGVAPSSGENWLDLGSNIGIFALWASNRGAEVTCYEPEPNCFELLELNHKGPNFNKGVSRENGSLMLYDSPRKTNSRATLIKVHGYREVGSVECVAASTLGSYDGVKCDIEGAELDILEDSWSIPCETLILEYHTSRLKKNWGRMKKHFDNLRDCFKDCYIGNDLIELSEGKRDQPPMYDRVLWCQGWRG